MRVRGPEQPLPARLEQRGGDLDVVGREALEAGAQAGEGHDGGGHLVVLGLLFVGSLLEGGGDKGCTCAHTDPPVQHHRQCMHVSIG